MDFLEVNRLIDPGLMLSADEQPLAEVSWLMDNALMLDFEL